MSRTWVLVVCLFVFLAGTGVGTALGYLTVILPRQAELERRDRTTPFLESFTPAPILQKLAPELALESQGDTERLGRNQAIHGKTFLVRGKVPPGQREALVDAWTAALQSELGAQGSYANETWKQASSGGAIGIQSQQRITCEGKFRGCIHTTALGQGDDLVLLIVVHDRH